VIFICDCGQFAPTERQRRFDDCQVHLNGVHVFVEREELSPVEELTGRWWCACDRGHSVYEKRCGTCETDQPKR
jgi:hypothetical protein